MTEQEWLVCKDPRAMYAGVPNQKNASVNDRRWRLLACAIQQTQLLLLPYDNHEQVRDFITDAIAWAESGEKPPYLGSSAYYVLMEPAYRGVYGIIQLPVGYPNIPEVDRKSADLFREVIGNPFRPVKVGCSRGCDIHNPDWLTPTVLSIAQQIYAAQDYTGMPILADALEEAGLSPSSQCLACDGKGWHPGDVGCSACGATTMGTVGRGWIPHPILEHLRGSSTHVRGCWALDLILGKE